MVALRVALNSLVSKWRLAMSGASQGSVLGLVLFDIFVGDMDCGIELSGAVDMLEGRMPPRAT